MACRLDVKKAILDEAFDKMFDGRYTFTRLTDDTVRINNRADQQQSKVTSKEQAFNIANERLTSMAQLFKGKVTGYVSESTPYDPITITLSVNPAYVEHEYQKLPDEEKTDPADNADFNQTEDTELSKASTQTLKLVKDLLDRIGVNIQQVNNIRINGQKVGANGAAIFAQQLVQVVRGKENVALTEETMHYVVEIIKQTNPTLYNQLLKEINNYRLYKDVLANYSTIYKTADGKPDILKLKEEAIAKVLAETVVNKNEGSTEKPELLAKVETWWSKIIDFVKGLFTKSGFDEAAMMVLSGEAIGTVDDIRNAEGIFYQTAGSTQDAIIEKLTSTNNKLTKDDSGYLIEGKRVGRRVTEIIKDWYSNRFADKDLTKTEFQKAIDDLKAEKGTAGHADFENMLKDHFLNEDGTLKPEDQRPDDSGYVSQLNPKNKDMYNILKRNMAERLAKFPAGTKFLSEVMVYEAKRDLAGTIDFVAVTPEGKVSLLDWKFMDLNTEKYEDVPWYKVNAWRQQMKQYKLILQNAYGVKSEDFEQTRMIPIKAIYSKADAKTNTLPVLTGIQIGDVDVKKEELAYLLPVGLEEEKTGNKKIDALIEKLNKIYETISSKKATPEEKRNKADQLNALYDAIRQLQVRQNIKPLVKQAKLLNAEVQRIIDDYKTNWEGKDPKSFTAEQKDEFSDRILAYETSLMVYTSLSTDLKSLFKGELSEEDEKVWKDIRETTENANELESDLEDVRKEFAENIIAKSLNVMEFLKPEKVIKGFSKWFSSTSTLQLKATEILYKMANNAFGLASMDTQTEGKKLQGYKEAYDKWAKAKGLTVKNYFDILKKKDKNELINEFNSEFYKTLNSKIIDKDRQWVRDNIDVAAYNEFLAKEKRKNTNVLMINLDLVQRKILTMRSRERNITLISYMIPLLVKLQVGCYMTLLRSSLLEISGSLKNGRN